MRGTHDHQGIRQGLRRIIPAYAGNTIQRSKGNFFSRDHPRVCGEHGRADQRNLPPKGSSPRMRGTPPCRPHPRRPAGIIPAYAGNTANCGARGLVHGDHPRVCGEHYERKRLAHQFQGSSPRMRGTRTVRESQGGTVGIIPAYAGNTRSWANGSRDPRDHPRVCGEHWMTIFAAMTILGSSPRMRGTRGQFQHDFQQRGIIPAYAGNTCRLFSGVLPFWDHPRVCGEHKVAFSAIGSAAGSSPRMRGTHGSAATTVEPNGIIPAYAGNTMLCELWRDGARDHPRVCGEHKQTCRTSLRK